MHEVDLVPNTPYLAVRCKSLVERLRGEDIEAQVLQEFRESRSGGLPQEVAWVIQFVAGGLAWDFLTAKIYPLVKAWVTEDLKPQRRLVIRVRGEDGKVEEWVFKDAEKRD